MLMPPLINKWNMLKDEDKDLFPLLEVGLVITSHTCLIVYPMHLKFFRKILLPKRFTKNMWHNIGPNNN